jgi:putative DNA methylase
MRTVIAASLVNANDVDEKRREEFLQAICLKADNINCRERTKEPDYPGQPERPAYNYNPNIAIIGKLSDKPLKNIRLLDVFAGGGSIPFEALRLGIGEVVAVEYNPVAYVILKAVLEYPLKYGPDLVKDVETWARWLLDEAKRRLKEYFPRHLKGNPTNYIWVRVYKCPKHGIEIPAIAFEYLSKKEKYGLKVEYYNNSFKVKVVKDKGDKTYESRAGLRCPKGHIITTKELAEIHKNAMGAWERGDVGHQPAVLVAVKLENGEYVEPTQEMLDAYEKARKVLKENFYEWLGKFIPEQEIPKGDETERLLSHRLDHFYKLFNARQLLVHATIIQLIREAYDRIIQEKSDPEYAKAVVTYLALAHGKLLDYNSVLTQWNTHRDAIDHTFDRHDFHIGQDFGEGDMITEEKGLLEWALFSNAGVVKALRKITELLDEARKRGQSVKVLLGDASDPALYSGLGSFDLVVTDPPYYANVNYAELSDYFYVWMKLSIGDLYPEAFAMDLAPKDREIVVNRTRDCDEKCFEDRMRSVFENIRYALNKDGLLVMVYGHRSFEGLKAMFRAALDAGFMITSLWSFASEMPESLNIVGKAAARSNMVIAFRPRVESGCFVKPGFVDEVLKEASKAFAEVYSNFNLSLVDALMAAHSAAFKVISRCWPLYMPDGSVYDLDKLENLVEKSVALAFAYNILGGDVDGSSLAYLITRGVYGMASYDDLRRLSIGLGFSHEEFIKNYCGESRESEGEKVYPILTLFEIRSLHEGRLVDALASILRMLKNMKDRSIDEVVRKLEDFGFKLNPVVCRYIDQLRQFAENDERELLGVIAVKCQTITNNTSNSVTNNDANSRKSAKLDDFF